MAIQTKSGNIIMGIDLGTTGLKAILYNEDGTVLGKGYCEYPIHTNMDGGAEQNPSDWADALCYCVTKAIQQSGIRSTQLSSIGFSGQMHGAVMLDEQNEPVYPAIIWCDKRSAVQCEKIRDVIGVDKLSKITSNEIVPGLMAASLLWVKDNRPDIYSKIQRVISPKDYLRYLLCGEIGCEITDASATSLFDVPNGVWSEEIIAAMGFNSDFFPQVSYPCEVAGHTHGAFSRRAGLSEGITVVYGGGDQVMQAFANGIFCSTDMSLTVGTGGQLLSASKKMNYDEKLQLNTFCHGLPDLWYHMGATLGACLSLNWFCGNILKDSDYKKMDKEVSVIPAGSGGLLYLPYIAGERTPLMDPGAEGVFWGLTLDTSRAHMYRAVLEGVAYSLYDAYTVLSQLHPSPSKLICTGGAMKSGLWAQIISDVFGRDLHITSLEESSAAGAAICAGVGCGMYSDALSGFEVMNRNTSYTVVHHDSDKAAVYRNGYIKYKHIYNSVNNIKN